MKTLFLVQCNAKNLRLSNKHSELPISTSNCLRIVIFLKGRNRNQRTGARCTGGEISLSFVLQTSLWGGYYEGEYEKNAEMWPSP